MGYETLTVDPTALQAGDVVVRVEDHDESGCHCDVTVTGYRFSLTPTVPDTRCVGCGDLIHPQADGPSVPADTPLSERTWFDSAGDPVCWAADNGNGPHVPAPGEEVSN